MQKLRISLFFIWIICTGTHYSIRFHILLSYNSNWNCLNSKHCKYNKRTGIQLKIKFAKQCPTFKIKYLNPRRCYVETFFVVFCYLDTSFVAIQNTTVYNSNTRCLVYEIFKIPVYKNNTISSKYNSISTASWYFHYDIVLLNTTARNLIHSHKYCKHNILDGLALTSLQLFTITYNELHA